MKNIPNYELIGLSVEISESKNNTYKGIKGKIIDETKQCIIIISNKKRKKIMKKNSTFRIEMGGKSLEVDGSLLIGRPEDRLKK